MGKGTDMEHSEIETGMEQPKTGQPEAGYPETEESGAEYFKTEEVPRAE